jgi:hypothetical protein
MMHRSVNVYKHENPNIYYESDEPCKTKKKRRNIARIRKARLAKEQRIDVIRLLSIREELNRR